MTADVALTAAAALLALIALLLAALLAFLGWAWHDVSRGHTAAWIADAYADAIARAEKAEQYSSDLFDTYTDLERLATRIADNTEESAIATREEHRR